MEIIYLLTLLFILFMYFYTTTDVGTYRTIYYTNKSQIDSPLDKKYKNFSGMRCPKNMIQNIQTGMCHAGCKYGYKYDAENNKCVNDCPANCYKTKNGCLRKKILNIQRDLDDVINPCPANYTQEGDYCVSNCPAGINITDNSYCLTEEYDLELDNGMYPNSCNDGEVLIDNICYNNN